MPGLCPLTRSRLDHSNLPIVQATGSFFSPHPILYSFSTYCGWLAPASWKVLLLWFWGTWFNIFPVPFFLFQVNFYWMTVLHLVSIQKVEVIICPFLNHFYSTEHCPRVFDFVKLHRKTFKTMAIKIYMSSNGTSATWWLFSRESSESGSWNDYLVGCLWKRALEINTVRVRKGSRIGQKEKLSYVHSPQSQSHGDV